MKKVVACNEGSEDSCFRTKAILVPTAGRGPSLQKKPGDLATSGPCYHHLHVDSKCDQAVVQVVVRVAVLEADSGFCFPTICKISVAISISLFPNRSR